MKPAATISPSDAPPEINFFEQFRRDFPDLNRVELLNGRFRRMRHNLPKYACKRIEAAKKLGPSLIGRTGNLGGF